MTDCAGRIHRTSATTAGLICAHHYADEESAGLLDGAVCGTAVLGALGAEIFRIVADRHWTTDVIVGWASGFLLGY